MRRRNAQQNGGVANDLHNGPTCDVELETEEKSEIKPRNKVIKFSIILHPTEILFIYFIFFFKTSIAFNVDSCK